MSRTRRWWWIMNPDHTVRPARNALEASNVMADFESRSVAQTDLGRYRVSTVFLTMDHTIDLDDPRPVLFETMVFRDGDGPGSDGDMVRRYYTWDEAVAGHAKIVSAIRSEAAEEKP